MQRIIDGNLFERRNIPDAWEIRTKRCNGVMMRSARQQRELVDLGPAPPWMLVPVDEWKPGEEEEAKEERRLKNLQKNARRAKSQCRDAIIAERFTEMLTLTYRDNMADLEVTKRHFAAWVRRMKKALGGTFRYCAAHPEKQDRGSYHWHIATHKLPVHALYGKVKIKAWEVGTKIWRDIVGKAADGKTNGLCFVGGKPSKWGHKRRKNMGLYKLASYVSKYILKDAESMPAGSHRFHRSLGSADIVAEVVRLHGVPLADLISVIFELAAGADVVSHHLGKLGDCYWLVTECGERGGKFAVKDEGGR